MLKNNFIQYLRTEKNYSAHTEISYLSDITQLEEFTKKEQGQFNPLAIDKDIIRSWIAELTEKGMSPKSVNRKLSAVKTFFNYLQKKGNIDINPTDGIIGPKIPKTLPSFINNKDMEALLDDKTIFDDSFEGIRDRFIIELLYVTGTRRAELADLKDQDINFQTKSIKVTGKRNKERIIPISDKTVEKLQEYIDIRDKNIKNISPYLFVMKEGTRIKPSSIYNIVNKYLGYIPTISKKSPHVLRHSFATEMLNSGAEISAVKEIMGHSSLASTEVYTHVTFKELKKAYNNAHPRAEK